MKTAKNKKWEFFCQVKSVTEKRLAYRILKKVLSLLTGKRVYLVPENHIFTGILDDLEFYSDALQRTATPEEMIKLYQKIIYHFCAEVKEKIGAL